MGQKTALITGASRGIGAATARKFAQEGYNIALNYFKSEESAMALATELRSYGVTVYPVKADVSDPGQVAHMVDCVLTEFCQLDILVCNAGIAGQYLLGDMTTEQWRTMMSTNLDSVFYCVHSALPQFISQKSGRIITVSSMWGITGASCEVAYSAAKAGVIGFTKALAKELGPSGITVNCVAPGVIATEMNGNLPADALAQLEEETPLGRIGTAEEVAQTIWFVASEGASFITGQVISPNGGLVI